MKKQEKKFVLAALVLLAITMVLLPLSGCKNDSVPEPTRYTVKFDKGDNSEYTGDLPADITVVSGTKLTAEQLEVLDSTDNYIFEGWYDGENKAEGGTYTVTKDVTLEAKWRDRGTVASVTFTLAGDIVTLSTATDGATIHYTTDGTDPKTRETRQEGNSVSITQQTTVKAYATKEGLKDSDVAARTYCVVTFNTPVTADTTLYAEWNGWDSDGNIVLKNKVMSKTSEEQVLPTGTFQMGSTAGYGDEKPVHGVTISKGYFMGRHEVTQQLYFAVMGKNPSYFKTGTENEEPKEGERELPVETVSWYDAVVFCNELSELMGLEPVYSKGGTTDTNQWGDVPTISDEGWNKIECNWDVNGYRLPTEAEWEYAARAGDDTTDKITWSGTDTETDLGKYAWYSDNSENKTHQVGTKDANSLELYDMSGNVWEWCWDWYDEKYYSSSSTESVTNPTGPADGSSGDIRVYRGGGWNDGPENCTVSRRLYYDPNYRYHDLGFRLVRSAN